MTKGPSTPYEVELRKLFWEEDPLDLDSRHISKFKSTGLVNQGSRVQIFQDAYIFVVALLRPTHTTLLPFYIENVKLRQSIRALNDFDVFIVENKR